ncbi:unnamed protein product [Brachionus calyciflorus]|uniref:Caspase 3 n=1 Tax=Brachionus calyciflorus TaxID=104777 RepID=A0A813M840_9BILA|nr:unnamed protein product [Brachionus calyciflorus]
MISNFVNRLTSSQSPTSPTKKNSVPKLIKFTKTKTHKTSGSYLKKRSKSNLIDTKLKSSTEATSIPIEIDENTRPNNLNMNFNYMSDRILNQPFESLQINDNQPKAENLKSETFFYSSKLTPNEFTQELNINIDKLTIGSSPREISRFADEPEYRMNYPRRGFAIIINNKRFDPRLDMPARDGTDLDADCLENTLKKLGFDTKRFNDCSASLIRELMLRYAKADHSDSDCFMTVIMSHGEDGVIYGIDKEIEIERLIQPFRLNRTLAGKPKLFFIQACRGNQLMEGIDSNPYDIQYVNKIPMEADFLIAYSTVSGYFSWRNSANGSWFIQSLCNILNEMGRSSEIMQILTAVNRRVAYHYESRTNDSSMNGKRQIPCIVSMLTKELYFKPKAQGVSVSYK